MSDLSTPWQELSSTLPGYEQRKNEHGYIETRPIMEVEEVEELSDECELCHVVMSTRDGMDPTKVCDNCAQEFYARMTKGE